jgi:hypothetical protein
MMFRIAADLVAGIHFLFVLFVLFGGLLVLRWPKLAWFHLPAAIWGVVIELGGWICPLTHWENTLRNKGFEAGYPTSFVDHYILPLIYPDLWFPGGFPRWGFVAIGLFVLILNAIVYWVLWQKLMKNRGES